MSESSQRRWLVPGALLLWALFRALHRRLAHFRPLVAKFGAA